MSSTKVVVTGGHGFVGSHLVERLVADGEDVTVLDLGRPPAELGNTFAGVRTVEGDVRDPDRVATAISGCDVVYHLAAVVGVDQYLRRPLDVVDVTVNGTRTVLAAAARAGSRVVVASTSEVFGKNPAVPWHEDADRVIGSTSADRWIYSTSKALAEHISFAFARQHGLSVTIVRYFNAYGPRQRPAFLISRNVHRALNGLPVIVYDGGGQTRSFTFVRDIVEGTLLAAGHPRADGRAYNLGGTVETSVADAARLVAELVDADVDVSGVDTSTSAGAAYEDLTRRMPDAGRARDELGWTARTPLEDGIARTIEWARANRWWLALPDSGF